MRPKGKCPGCIITQYISLITEYNYLDFFDLNRQSRDLTMRPSHKEIYGNLLVIRFTG
jgi:hypothetical protein